MGRSIEEGNRPRIPCNNRHDRRGKDNFKPEEKTIICTQCNANLVHWRHNNIVQQIRAKVKEYNYFEFNDMRNIEPGKIGNLKPDLVNT